MKLLILSPDLDVKGGVTSVVKLHLEGLKDQNKYEVKQFSTCISEVPLILKILYAFFKAFCFLFVVGSCDVIHIHSSKSGSFYRKSYYTIMCKLFRKKVLIHLHGSSFEAFRDKNVFNKWIVRSTLNRVDGIIVLSKQMEKLVMLYCENRNILILNNPVITNNDIKINKRHQKDKIRLLFLGEICKRKGIYDLVDTISSIDEKIKDRILLDVGGNNEIENLKDVIKKLGLTEIVTVHGWIGSEKKGELLENADIFVLPSYFEALPMAILEAMAYSLPIISTDVGGIPEIVKNDYNGIIISAGDKSALAEAIEKLILSEEMRINFGNNAKIIVAEYSLESVMDKLLKIYNKVFSK